MTPAAFARHVEFLANPQLGGRVAGTAGNRVAGDYIAGQFRQIGLKPVGDGGTFYQAFSNGRLLVPTTACDLRFTPPPAGASQPEGGAVAVIGRLGRDFAPSAQGALGAFEAPVLFAGYGVHNHIRKYDDYATVSARGTVVLILAGEPHNAAGQSKWALPGESTYWAKLPSKLRLAREQGAVGVLVVTPPALSPTDDIDDVLGDSAGALPCLRITREFADRLLAAAGHARTIEQIVAAMHDTGHPASFAVGGRLAGKVALTDATCRNVLGELPSDGPGDGRVILIGAHYDHIPATGQLAVDNGPGVRPGANDNASGVAAVLLLARGLALTPGRRSTFIFAAFDSEEVGFAGSRHYVRQPAVPLDRLDVMINIDEIGRIGGRGVLVLGSTLDSPLAGAIAWAARRNQLTVRPIPITSDQHWSDQAAFVNAGLPTLFLYGWTTGGRHTRQDVASAVDADRGAAAARLVYGIIHALRASSLVVHDG